MFAGETKRCFCLIHKLWTWPKKVCSDENSSYMSKTFITLLFAAAAYVIFFLKKNGNERRSWEKLQKPSFYLTNQV